MYYYSFHVGDYLLATTHLSLQEDATYRRLIDHYMQEEAPISSDTAMVARRIRAPKKLVDAILNEFFDATDEGWTHPRCEAELKKSYEISEAARNRANSRWNRGSQKSLNNQGSSDAAALPQQYVGNAHAMQPNTHNPIPIKNICAEGAVEDKSPPGFVRFWDAYPVKKGKAAALSVWKKKKLEGITDKIIDSITRHQEFDRSWASGYIKHPQTYLTQNCWEDEFDESKPINKGNGKVELGKKYQAAL